MKKTLVVLFVMVLALMAPAAAFANSAAGSTGSISKSEALAIALKDVGLKKSQVIKTEVEAKKNVVEVEFTQKSAKAEYEYAIEKSSGKIIEKEVDYAYKHNASKAKIGKTAALKKVAKASGFKYSIVKKAKCKYTYKKNEGKYEVTFRHNGYKYEYKLLACNGKVIELEMDLLVK